MSASDDDGDARIERWAREVLESAMPGAFAGRPATLERAVLEYAHSASADVVREADVRRVVRASAYVQTHRAVVAPRVAQFNDDVEAMCAAGYVNDVQLSEFDRRVLAALETIHARVRDAMSAGDYFVVSDNAMCFTTVTTEFDRDLFDDVVNELMAQFREPNAVDGDDLREPAVWMTRELARTTANTVVMLVVFRHRVRPDAAADGAYTYEPLVA